MCRHLGCVGQSMSVGEVLVRGSHSLRTQSWAPREMRGAGTINADGFGVAWWLPSAEDVSGRRSCGYRNAAAIWTDPAVEEVLPQLVSPAVVAAVRSASVGMPVERAACAPFTAGRWAFSHNGVIPDWQSTLTAVADEFGSPSLLSAQSRTDSATLWVILAALLADPLDSNDIAAALRRLTRAVVTRSPTAWLNLLLCDGATIWATTWRHALSALVTATAAVVASEPYDDDARWRAIPDGHMVTAAPGRLTVVPLLPEKGFRHARSNA